MRTGIDDERELEAALPRCVGALLDVVRSHGRCNAAGAVFEEPASAGVRCADMALLAAPWRLHHSSLSVDTYNHLNGGRVVRSDPSGSL